MKIFKPFLALCILASVVACGGTENKNETSSDSKSKVEKADKNQASGMIKVDLSDYNIMATIMIPDESKGKAIIEENEMGGVNIKVGDNYAIAINPFGLPLEEFKNELLDNKVYQTELKEESDKHLLYSIRINDSDLEAEFHFFMNKEINGETFEIRSIMDKSFSEGSLEIMYESAQTLEAKSMG